MFSYFISLGKKRAEIITDNKAFSLCEHMAHKKLRPSTPSTFYISLWQNVFITSDICNFPFGLRRTEQEGLEFLKNL